MKAKVVRINKFGPPEVMQIETLELPSLKANEVLLRQTTIGFNFIDISQRSGELYKLPLPSFLGHEAVGVIEAIGNEVKDFSCGDRVVYMNAPIGAYADFRNISADKLVKIPNEITDIQAATLFFKGLTAQYLISKTYKVKPDDMVIIHAAAGGVGQILCKWAKSLGAYVVGTASSEAKCQTALDSGCDIAINYSNDNWSEVLLEVSQGRKANVVYDSVGKDTLLKSMDCLNKFGLLVNYGASSGPAPAIDPELLNKKGCLYLTRPSVFAHNSTPSELRANAQELFNAIKSDIIKMDQVTTFKLDEVVKAHQLVESRAISGAIVFIP